MGPLDHAFRNVIQIWNFLVSRIFFHLFLPSLLSSPQTCWVNILPLGCCPGLLFITFLSFFSSLDRVSLSFSVWSWTHSVVQIGLELEIFCPSLRTSGITGPLLSLGHSFWACLHPDQRTYSVALVAISWFILYPPIWSVLVNVKDDLFFFPSNTGY